MNAQQPESLRLADELCEALPDYPEPCNLEKEAAAELLRLHAENEMLRQSLLVIHDTLEMTARSGASYAAANEVLRETVIRWASRAEQAENMLEAIGAGGVGNAAPHLQGESV